MYTRNYQIKRDDRCCDPQNAKPSQFSPPIPPDGTPTVCDPPSAQSNDASCVTEHCVTEHCAAEHCVTEHSVTEHCVTEQNAEPLSCLKNRAEPQDNPCPEPLCEKTSGCHMQKPDADECIKRRFHAVRIPRFPENDTSVSPLRRQNEQEGKCVCDRSERHEKESPKRDCPCAENPFDRTRKPENPDKCDKCDNPDRGEKQDKCSHPDRGDRPDRGERQDKCSPSDRCDRLDKGLLGALSRHFSHDEMFVLSLAVLLICQGGDEILILALCFILM